MRHEPCEPHGVAGDCGTCRMIETTEQIRALLAEEPHDLPSIGGKGRL